MRLFFSDKGMEPEKLAQLAETRIGGNGKKAKQIQGFQGMFGFSLEDVWLSDAVEEAMAGNLTFMGELVEILKRFIRADWGLYVMRSQIWSWNAENRGFGPFNEELGLYETSRGNVYVHLYRDEGRTMIWFQDEPEAEQVLMKRFGEAIHDPAGEKGWNFKAPVRETEEGGSD